jgi:pimeloyl-ACP methyl ester carboxylesterase
VWDLVRPRLERRYEVLAPALPGHLGGPPLPEVITATTMAEAVEAVMDEAGLDSAHIVGNSVGGHVALQLAARGRARSVVALAPAGGWEPGDRFVEDTFAYFAQNAVLLRGAERRAAFIASTPEGRRQATAYIAERPVPAGTVIEVIRAAALCTEAPRMIAFARQADWTVGPIECPVRVVWGTKDRLLPWPRAAARYRRELPHAEWVEPDDVGHCPQLDVPLITAELIA